MGVLDPEIEWRPSGVLPDLAERLPRPGGSQGVLERLAWTGSWEQIRIEPEEFVNLTRGCVLDLAHWRTSGRDQIDVNRPVAFVFTLRDGLLVRFPVLPGKG